MEKLMKPVEYANEIGISRQAVYAKIKKGLLRSKNVDGKLYIVVDDKEPVNGAGASTAGTRGEAESSDRIDYETLLKAKDETIEVLKGSLKELKESNKEISTTLRGEIDLLKEAFHEMRTLYRHQLEAKKEKAAVEAIEVDSHEETVVHEDRSETIEETVWVSVKKFMKHYDVKKRKEKLLKRLNKAYKKGDPRVMKIDGKLKIDLHETYEDIIG